MGGTSSWFKSPSVPEAPGAHPLPPYVHQEKIHASQTIPFAVCCDKECSLVTPSINELYNPVTFAKLLGQSQKYIVPEGLRCPGATAYLLDFLVEHPDGDDFLYRVIREGFGLKHLQAPIEDLVDLVWWFNNIEGYICQDTPQAVEHLSQMSYEELYTRFGCQVIHGLHGSPIPDNSRVALIFAVLTGARISQWNNIHGVSDVEGRCILKAAIRDPVGSDLNRVLYSCWKRWGAVFDHHREECLERSLVVDLVPGSEVLKLLREKRYLVPGVEELVAEYVGVDNFWTLPLVKSTPCDPNFTPEEHRKWFFENLEKIKATHISS